nr:hypothetical protein [Tanacetum cinerariifolium]
MPWRHKNSSVVDPLPTSVRAEDIHRLCESIINVRPVHPTMLYEISLTTIWKHVRYHPVLKDGEGNGNLLPSSLNFSSFPCLGVRIGKGTALVANKVIAQHTTTPLPPGSQITEKSDYQKVFEHEDERVLAAKRKAQAAKDKAAGKRSATEGTSQRTKRKKTAPISFGLSESEPNNSTCSNLTLESANRPKGDTENSLGNAKNDTESCTLLILMRIRMLTPMEMGCIMTRDMSTFIGIYDSGYVLSSSSSGLGRQVFPQRNPGGDGSSLQANVSLPASFIPVWNLTTYSILNDDESCRDMMINLATPRYEVLNDDYRELYQSHRSCQDVFDRKRLLSKSLLRWRRKKTSFLTRTESKRNKSGDWKKPLLLKHPPYPRQRVLKGDLERLTVNLSHAEIVRHNYVRQLLPTMVRRLFSSEEYKKRFSDVFNQAIAAGWSEGVEVECSDKMPKPS